MISSPSFLFSLSHLPLARPLPVWPVKGMKEREGRVYALRFPQPLLQLEGQSVGARRGRNQRTGPRSEEEDRGSLYERILDAEAIRLEAVIISYFLRASKR